MGTHPEALCQIATDLGGRWPQHQAYILGIRSANRVHADLVLLQRDKPFGEEEFPRDLNERIKTRLGEGDRNVDLEEEVVTPFGNTVTSITLPAHYISDAGEHVTAENVTVRFWEQDVYLRSSRYSTPGFELQGG